MKFQKFSTLALSAALILLPMSALAESDSNVSVIGGADGPTSIMVASSPAGTTVTVTGNGSVSFKPDTASITLGVSQTESGAVEAQSFVNGVIDSIKKALSEKGVADTDISVSDLSLWGNYDYSGDTQRLTGYTASHTLTIKTGDMDAVGPLIDVALGAGANQLQGVSFSVTNNAEAYEKALALAVANAQEKAEVLAKAAGMTLGGLSSVTESDSYGYNTYYAKSEADDGAGAGYNDTQVDTGMVDINASVIAVYMLVG